MRARVDGAALNTASQWVAQFAPSGTAAPALGGIALAADDRLSLSAIDGDTFGTAACDTATVTRGGRAVVSARLFADITKLLKRDTEATLAHEGTTLEIRCGSARWTLPTLRSQDHLAAPGPGEALGSVPAGALREALRQVLPALDPLDSSSLNMSGVEITLGDTLTLAGTNRYRLSVASLPWAPAPGGADRAIVVPGPSLHAALKILADGDVELSANGNMISITAPGHQLTSRLLDGAYTSWRRVMPDAATMPTTVTVGTAELLSAARNVMVVAEPKKPITITTAGAVMGLTAGAGVGNAKDSVETRAAVGDSVTVRVNPRYFTDTLGRFQSPAAILSFRGPGEAFLIRPADDGGAVVDGYQHVLMALRGTAR